MTVPAGGAGQTPDQTLDTLRERALEAFRQALQDAAPDRLVAQALRLEGRFKANFDLIELVESEGPVHVFACGKAAPEMLRAALKALGSRAARAICISPEAPPPAGSAAGGVYTLHLQGDHPLPGEKSGAAGLAALKWLQGIPPAPEKNPEQTHRLLVLLSGGTSALIGIPYPEFSVNDAALTVQLLLNSGATIREINTVRKHLSPVLGGGLLRALPAHVEPVVLLLSDVPGNDLTTIGSGPFIPDPTTMADARSVTGRFRLEAKLPAAVKKFLFDSGLSQNPAPEAARETLKPGERVTPVHLVLADNSYLLDRIGAAFKDAVYTKIIGRGEQDPVDAAVERHLDLIAETGSDLAADSIPGLVVLVSGGELTVEVGGKGTGGRNTHYALRFISAIRNRGLRLRPWVLLSVGSDGRDGATPAAGALADSRSWERAEGRGLDPGDYLARFDSFSFFEKTGELVTTGPTGNNLNDVRVVLLA